MSVADKSRAYRPEKGFKLGIAVLKLITLPGHLAFLLAIHVGAACILAELLWMARWKVWENQYLSWRFQTFCAETPERTPSGLLRFCWRRRLEIYRFATWAAIQRWGNRRF